MVGDLLPSYHIYKSVIRLNLLSLTDCLMFVIMAALPQLNCGRATCTTVYTISSTVDVLVYAMVITVIMSVFKLS